MIIRFFIISILLSLSLSAAPLTIDKITPVASSHKNSITLSNGIKYKIYPFDGWDLDHWKVGHSVRIEGSQDPWYKIQLNNLDTQDSISVKIKIYLTT